MKNLYLAVLSFAFIFVSSCASRQTTRSVSTETAGGIQAVVDGHTSQNSLDWWGTYTGVLPCASCEGIKTTVTLTRDLNYTMKAVYLGEGENDFLQIGTFRWNKAGNTITLSDSDGGDAQFFVGENQLIRLDRDGNRITGSLAENYILKKQTSIEEPALVNTIETSGWQLIELMGKPIEDNLPGKKSPDMIFNKSPGRVAGFAGCNQYFGSYELRDYNRINIEKIGSTMMACSEKEMKLEQEFLKVLERADNYEIAENVLIFYKAKTAPLARFRAINVEKD